MLYVGLVLMQLSCYHEHQSNCTYFKDFKVCVNDPHCLMVQKALLSVPLMVLLTFGRALSLYPHGQQKHSNHTAQMGRVNCPRMFTLWSYGSFFISCLLLSSALILMLQFIKSIHLTTQRCSKSIWHQQILQSFIRI